MERIIGKKNKYDYDPTKKLGKGGQGSVFKARVADGIDEGKEVALKFLDSDRVNACERFRREFKITKDLKDERIIGIFELIKPNDQNKDYCIVMEYIEGGDLSKPAEKGYFKKDILKGLKIFREIAEGVKIAHENLIIHRDLKPQNILLRNDSSPVITDFGICYVINDKLESLSITGEEVGTRNYIAPELRGNIQQDPKFTADIYSLGKVLYYMLSGGLVMDREEYDSQSYDIRKFPDISKRTKGNLEYVYDRIFPKTIRFLPSERFQNVKELINELDKIIELVEEHFYPFEIGRKCIVCGEGEYTIIKGRGDLPGREMGLNLICSNCGNLQFFERTEKNIKIINKFKQ